jgi:hypothetical protein
MQRTSRAALRDDGLERQGQGHHRYPGAQPLRMGGGGLAGSAVRRAVFSVMCGVIPCMYTCDNMLTIFVVPVTNIINCSGALGKWRSNSDDWKALGRHFPPCEPAADTSQPSTCIACRSSADYLQRRVLWCGSCPGLMARRCQQRRRFGRAPHLCLHAKNKCPYHHQQQ